MKHLLNKQGMGNGSSLTELFCDNQSNTKPVMHAMTCHAYKDRTSLHNRENPSR
jgi:hypothetical protein